MVERRSLLEGLDSIEPGERTVEQQFVYGKKARRVTPPMPAPATMTLPSASEPSGTTVAEPPPPETEKPRLTPLTGIGRVPVGARIRTELATSPKRASLERQLQGIEPNSLQDILEAALEPWLRWHGYLK
jgi:hypothetical protein